MKRVGNLFETATSFPHLLQCYKKARQGTRKSLRLCTFGFQLENELLQLQEELRSGSYQPRPYRYFTVNDPKRRTIAVADFRDRVVHHAVVGVLEPIYERCFIHDSYATRKGKGAHAAVFQAQKYLRQNEWFIKTDIQKYFDSIQHDVLMDLIERKVKDRQLLELIPRILSNGGLTGIGLPIGNLTSQFFANVYLNAFDHWVKEKMRIPHYVRYMDDFVLFQPEKKGVKEILGAVKEELDQYLKLNLKPSATFINRRENGLSFLGTRIFSNLIRLHPDNAKRALSKLRCKQKEWVEGYMDEEKYLQSLNSYTAYFSIYDTYHLRQQLMNEQLGSRALLA